MSNKKENKIEEELIEEMEELMESDNLNNEDIEQDSLSETEEDIEQDSLSEDEMTMEERIAADTEIEARMAAQIEEEIAKEEIVNEDEDDETEIKERINWENEDNYYSELEQLASKLQMLLTMFLNNQTEINQIYLEDPEMKNRLIDLLDEEILKEFSKELIEPIFDSFNLEEYRGQIKVTYYSIMSIYRNKKININNEIEILKELNIYHKVFQVLIQDLIKETNIIKGMI